MQLTSVALPEQWQPTAHPPLLQQPPGFAAFAASMYEQGFAMIGAEAMIALTGDPAGGDHGAALRNYAASWWRLGLDNHMQDGGTYRERSLANFRAADPDGPFVRAAPQPHFQAVEHNQLNGGIERVYQETEPEVASAPMAMAGMSVLRGAGEMLSARRRWTCEFHQFRILASLEQAGQPTPEGMHRDGVDWVFIQLIARENVDGGETTLTTADGTLLARITMDQPFSALVLDDRRIRHGVTAIVPRDPARPAYRDTVVATMKALD